MRKDCFQKIQSNTRKIVAQNPVILSGSREDRRNGRSPAEGIETLHYQDRQRFRHRRNGRSPAETMKWIGEILVLCYRNRECLFGIIRFYLDVFNTLILSAA